MFNSLVSPSLSQLNWKPCACPNHFTEGYLIITLKVEFERSFCYINKPGKEPIKLEMYELFVTWKEKQRRKERKEQIDN